MAERSVKTNGERVRKLRLRCGYTQAELATKARVSSKTVWHAEHDYGITPRRLRMIAEALGEDVSSLAADCGPDRSWPVPLREDSVVSVVTTFDELLAWEMRIVAAARVNLVTTGSRSRDEAYLNAIEDKLSSEPHLTYYRVLFGPPFMDVLRNHLIELVKMRPPMLRRKGAKTLNLAIIDDMRRYPEVFICANEETALVVQPSFSGVVNAFDSAIVYNNPEQAQRLIHFVMNLYAAGRTIESVDDIRALRIMHRESQFV